MSNADHKPLNAIVVVVPLAQFDHQALALKREARGDFLDHVNLLAVLQMDRRDFDLAQRDGNRQVDLRQGDGDLFKESTLYPLLHRLEANGFVDYYWPKYGADEPQPKLSFVKLFKEWNWIIGTGVYIDNIDTLVEARKNEIENTITEASITMENQIASIKEKIQKNR